MAEKTYKDIKELKPELQPLVKEFLEEARVGDWQAFLTETYRTQERQKELYDAGKTPSKVATFHFYRKAFDIAMFKNGRKQVSWDFKLYEKVAPIAEKQGWTWGGRWKVKDGCHFQWEGPKPKPAPKPTPKPNPCSKEKAEIKKLDEALKVERRVVQARDEEADKLRIEAKHFADRAEKAEKKIDKEREENEKIQSRMASSLIVREKRIKELELLVNSLTAEASAWRGVVTLVVALKNSATGILRTLKGYFRRGRYG